MLLPLQRLLSRIRARSPRDEDLHRLRARFTAQPSVWSATREQRRLAARIAELKRELAGAFSGLRSCHGCARGEPEPKGRWDGGRCCGTRTLVVFTPDEVHALKLGGVRARDLVPPDEDLAGCAFRGSRGCSLAPDQRPAVCLVYACADLKGELGAHADAERVHALRSELHETYAAFLRSAGAIPPLDPAP